MSGETKKPTVEELAQQLENLLSGLRISISSFSLYFKMGKDADTMPGRIHFQTGALEMLDDVNRYLPAMADTEKLLRFGLLKSQEHLTQRATEENGKKGS